MYGPSATPLPEAEAGCRRLLAAAADNQVTSTFLRCCLGYIVVAQGRLADGRRAAQDARDQLAALGRKRFMGEATTICAHIEWITGDTETAEREYARATTAMEAVGDNEMVASTAAMWARRLCELGRNAEAVQLCDRLQAV